MKALAAVVAAAALAAAAAAAASGGAGPPLAHAGAAAVPWNAAMATCAEFLSNCEACVADSGCVFCTEGVWVDTSTGGAVTRTWASTQTPARNPRAKALTCP